MSKNFLKQIRITPAEIYNRLMQSATNISATDCRHPMILRAWNSNTVVAFRAEMIDAVFGDESRRPMLTTTDDGTKVLAVALPDNKFVLLSQAYAHNPDLIRARRPRMDGEIFHVENFILTPTLDMDAGLLEELYIHANSLAPNPENVGLKTRREKPITFKGIFTHSREYTTVQKLTAWLGLGITATAYLAVVTYLMNFAAATLLSLLGSFGGIVYSVLAIGLIVFMVINLYHIRQQIAVVDWMLAVFWPVAGEAGGLRRIGQAAKNGATAVAKSVKRVGSGILGFFSNTSNTIKVKVA